MAYATTTQLATVLGIKKEVPSWGVGMTPAKEEVAVGTGSAAVVYLDHRNVLASSYTLYYGATESASTSTLTETTHYTIDKTKGEITITSAGATLLSTNKLFAIYSYIDQDDVNLSDSTLSDVLDRANAQVKNLLNTEFTDGTGSNPAYPSRTEVQESKGVDGRRFFTQKKPLKDVTTLVAAQLLVGGTTLTVTTGEGTSKFPTSGYVVIGSEVIAYTGTGTSTLTGLSRGQLGSTAAQHEIGEEVHSTIIQASGTQEGGSPDYDTLAWNTDVYADENGQIYVYEDSWRINADMTRDRLSLRPDIPNRFKVIYRYGFDTIPKDIVRLELLLAKKMLMVDTIATSFVKGRNEFRPELLNADQGEIDMIVNTYRQWSIDNV